MKITLIAIGICALIPLGLIYVTGSRIVSHATYHHLAVFCRDAPVWLPAVLLVAFLVGCFMLPLAVRRITHAKN